MTSDDTFSPFGPQATRVSALAPDLGLVPAIRASLETPTEPRHFGEADPSEGPDPDDTAVWLDEDDADRSFVIAAMESDGLRIFGPAGEKLDRVTPGGTRYNIADGIRDTRVPDLLQVTSGVAVAPDRANDTAPSP